ncbi:MULTISPECIES: hypothetical protein [unclassified Streptomyces]|uniref:hypothetical protein n=1 Tax=unclassified Streptomyces TaxID=2593676 RepID=UPI00332D6246
MRRTIRTASLCAVLAAAVLAGGGAQAYAASSSAAQEQASMAPAAPTAASASGIWIWTGEFASHLEAEANYWVLYGLGAATQMLIEYSGHSTWVLYIQ